MREGGREHTEGKSFRNFHFVCRSVLSLWFSGQLVSSLFVN